MISGNFGVSPKLKNLARAGDGIAAKLIMTTTSGLLAAAFCT